ncbi:mitochondrial dicarboxylate carrier [Ascobolus immersus RN42]|uniref:Mitochondrial dicarboxylate carrier n=1 Tax=Ascobolus immersus RN42 TaxID=1160509 RepID=A0A3N4IPP4_ASCIM|nr:mitochondrial dicarboxylate carrier [Ascobolus immersus RN42]
MSQSTSKHIQYPFWFGGSASCMAACLTHPLDLVKVRLQTVGKHWDGKPPTMGGMFKHIVKAEGMSGLYQGLSASILRQATYSTTRFGLYASMKDTFFPGTEKPGFYSLVMLSSISGFVGGVAGNPADVINVRMQHDASLPKDQRRNYKNALDGILRMSKHEGVSSLYRGVWPNSLRATLMTASQLATYDQFKSLLLTIPYFGDDLITHFSASFLAGFVATTVCSPVDVIKTRIMTSNDSKGILHLLKDTTKNEGIKWVFRGWVPSFIRLGPQTIATFIALEQHKKLYRWLKEEKTEDKVAV